MALMRNTEPLAFWQSRQRQQWVMIGAASIRKRTCSHWQAPVSGTMMESESGDMEIPEPIM